MSTESEQGWESLKSAKQAFEAWVSSCNISLACIHHIATFEDWSKDTCILIFFPTDADLAQHKATGRIQDIEKAYRQFLIDAKYPTKRFPVSFEFDSHENVVKNFEGSYFFRLR